MQKKFIRFQEKMKDEEGLDIVVTVAGIQTIHDGGKFIESGPSYSIESNSTNEFQDERVEYLLTSQEFDEILKLYENDKKKFLFFNRSEDREKTNV